MAGRQTSRARSAGIPETGLVVQVVRLYAASDGTYGASRIRADLVGEDWQVSVKTFAKAMQLAGYPAKSFSTPNMTAIQLRPDRPFGRRTTATAVDGGAPECVGTTPKPNHSGQHSKTSTTTGTSSPPSTSYGKAPTPESTPGTTRNAATPHSATSAR